MEVQSDNKLQDTLHNIKEYSAASVNHNYGRVISAAQDLVELYNDAEISGDSQLSSKDYQLFLIAHLILLDTVNARFLWKRIPKSFKVGVEGT